jgi:CubicO group peptidase (beta-lactamase class C family)
MIRPLVGVALATVTLARDASAQTAEPYPGLDAYLAKAVQMWKVPGISVAIVRNDSVIYAKGFGVRAAGSRDAVNERTLFEIGSDTKSFTATTIAMLVSEGRMRWDAPISEYLPDFRMYDPVANTAVTIRDALSHRSGIGRGELVWVGSGATRDELVHRIRFMKPESPFRSQFSYQNVMYLVAGQAAGRAAGSTWEEQVRQRILVPVGMTSSVTTYKGMTETNVSLPHGMDHDTAFRRPPFNAENIAPAGAVISNAVDMAKWVRFHLNDGVVNGKRLIESAALRETHTPQIIVGRGSAVADSLSARFPTYAMGWLVEDYRSRLLWQHSGGTIGMTSQVGLLPERKFGVVVLSNMGSTTLPKLLQDYIFDRELGAPVRDLSGDAYARLATQRRRADSVASVQDAEHPAGALPPLPLSAYAGTFADSLYGTVTISVKDGHLALEHGEWNGPLQYWNANNFRWTLPLVAAIPVLPVRFDVSPDNTVTGLYFGLGADVNLLGRVAQPRGNRRGGTQ